MALTAAASASAPSRVPGAIGKSPWVFFAIKASRGLSSPGARDTGVSAGAAGARGSCVSSGLIGVIRNNINTDRYYSTTNIILRGNDGFPGLPGIRTIPKPF